MSKKSKAKAKKRYKDDDDYPVYVRPPKEAPPSFACPRCQANVGTAANLPDHQLDAHAYGGQRA